MVHNKVYFKGQVKPNKPLVIFFLRIAMGCLFFLAFFLFFGNSLLGNVGYGDSLTYIIFFFSPLALSLGTVFAVISSWPSTASGWRAKSFICGLVGSCFIYFLSYYTFVAFFPKVAAYATTSLRLHFSTELQFVLATLLTVVCAVFTSATRAYFDNYTIKMTPYFKIHRTMLFICIFSFTFGTTIPWFCFASTQNFFLGLSFFSSVPHIHIGPGFFHWVIRYPVLPENFSIFMRNLTVVMYSIGALLGYAVAWHKQWIGKPNFFIFLLVGIGICLFANPIRTFLTIGTIKFPHYFTIFSLLYLGSVSATLIYMMATLLSSTKSAIKTAGRIKLIVFIVVLIIIVVYPLTQALYATPLPGTDQLKYTPVFPCLNLSEY